MLQKCDELAEKAKNLVLARTKLRMHLKYVTGQPLKYSPEQRGQGHFSQAQECCVEGAASRNSAKLGNYKMPVKLRET